MIVDCQSHCSYPESLYFLTSYIHKISLSKEYCKKIDPALPKFPSVFLARLMHMILQEERVWNSDEDLFLGYVQSTMVIPMCAIRRLSPLYTHPTSTPSSRPSQLNTFLLSFSRSTTLPLFPPLLPLYSLHAINPSQFSVRTSETLPLPPPFFHTAKVIQSSPL